MPELDEAIPRRVEVTCGIETTVLNTEVVQASRDGTSFDVSGKAGWMFLVGYGDHQDVLLLQQDSGSFTSRAPPGDVSVGCVDPGDQAVRRAPGPWATLRIEDPVGWYRSIELELTPGGDCADGIDREMGLDRVHEVPDRGVVHPDRGVEVPPIIQARTRLRNLQQGDSIERGGWSADEGVVRVVRQAQPIGVLRFLEDDTGGWLLSGASLCGGLSLAPG